MHPKGHRNESPLAKTLSLLSSDTGIAAVTILTVLAIYVLDTITPLGEPVWLLYLIPLILSYRSERYFAIPAVCGAITLFLIAGFFLSPQGILPAHAFLYRLGFFLFFLCVTAVLFAIRRNQLL